MFWAKSKRNPPRYFPQLRKKWKNWLTLCRNGVKTTARSVWVNRTSWSCILRPGCSCLFGLPKVGALFRWALASPDAKLLAASATESRFSSIDGYDWGAIGSGVATAALLLAGPIGWVAAVVTFVGWVFSWFSRDSWQTVVARNCIEALRKQQIKKKYVEAIHQFWDDTRNAFNPSIKGMVSAAREEAARLPEKYNSAQKPILENELRVNRDALAEVNRLRRVAYGKFA